MSLTDALDLDGPVPLSDFDGIEKAAGHAQSCTCFACYRLLLARCRRVEGEHSDGMCVPRDVHENMVASDSLAAEAAKERAKQAERELERWKHGKQIEGDYVCPHQLRADEAEREIERLVELCEQLCRDRADALTVKTRDGFTASEWIMRTGKAEREAAELRERLARITNGGINAAHEALDTRIEALRAEARAAKGVAAELRQAIFRFGNCGHGWAEPPDCQFCRWKAALATYAAARSRGKGEG